MNFQFLSKFNNFHSFGVLEILLGSGTWVLFSRQYSGHKSCFFPHPRYLRNLFSSRIFRGATGNYVKYWPKMARNAENLGFSLPQLCEMANIGLNFPLFGERNKKIPRFLDFLSNFFLGSRAVFFPTSQDSCFIPTPGGIWPEYWLVTTGENRTAERH